MDTGCCTRKVEFLSEHDGGLKKAKIDLTHGPKTPDETCEPLLYRFDVTDFHLSWPSTIPPGNSVVTTFHWTGIERVHMLRRSVQE
jgi:hypothetical protein